MRSVLALTARLAAQTAVLTQFPIPRDLNPLVRRIPTVDSILRGTPLLSTGFDDTRGICSVRHPETEYDDSIPPRILPGDERVRACAFKTVRLVRPKPAGGAPEVLEAHGRGYTFVRTRSSQRSPSRWPRLPSPSEPLP